MKTLNPIRQAASLPLLILSILPALCLGSCNKSTETPASSPGAGKPAPLIGRVPASAPAPTPDAPQNAEQAAPQKKVPAEELKGIINEIHAMTPPGVGTQADAVARNYFLISRDKLSQFIKENSGTDEATYAHIMRATLSIAGGANGEATTELREVLQTLGEGLDGRRGGLKIEALTWLSQTDPATARKHLEGIVNSNTQYSRRALKLLRLANAVEFYKVDAPAPAWACVSVDNKTIAKETQAGKVTLLYFWSSAVKPSLDGVAELRKIDREFGGQGLEIIHVCMDGNEIRSVPGHGEPVGLGAPAAIEFAKEFKIPGTLVYDGRGYDSDLAEIFVVNSLPGSVLIDRAGIVRAFTIPSGEMSQKVREVMNRK